MTTATNLFSLDEILYRIVSNLDITDAQFQAAKDRYEAVGKWLDAENSPLAPFQPVIVPQGSFRLGTVIKPWTDADEFDVDLLCLLRKDEYPG